MSGVKKNAIVTIMPYNFFCSKGRNSTIDPANEELKNPYNDDNGNHRPCKQQIVKWSNVPYNLMDGLVCNIVRDFLRVMLHFATESEARDNTH